jgi:hypothetical protein
VNREPFPFPDTDMQPTNRPLIHLDGVSKVFYTEEVETHALASIHLEIQQTGSTGWWASRWRS